MQVRITPTGCLSMNRRSFSRHLAMLSGAAWAMACTGPAAADGDGDTKSNVTRQQYDSVTQHGVEGQPKAPEPTPVHNFVEEDGTGQQSVDRSPDVQEAHGTRMLKGKEWKSKTPQERDDYLRDLQSRFPGARILLTVPKGEVWVIPEDDYQRLKANRTIKPFTKGEVAKIHGQTVPQDADAEVNSDRSGSTGEVSFGVRFKL
jgi:hypothetical protein